MGLPLLLQGRTVDAGAQHLHVGWAHTLPGEVGLPPIDHSRHLPDQLQGAYSFDAKVVQLRQCVFQTGLRPRCTH